MGTSLLFFVIHAVISERLLSSKDAKSFTNVIQSPRSVSLGPSPWVFETHGRKCVLPQINPGPRLFQAVFSKPLKEADIGEQEHPSAV